MVALTRYVLPSQAPITSNITPHGVRHNFCPSVNPLMGNRLLYSNTLTVDGWALTFDSPLLSAPNVTVHPSTASVPPSCYSMRHYNYRYPLKVKDVRTADLSMRNTADADCFSGIRHTSTADTQTRTHNGAVFMSVSDLNRTCIVSRTALAHTHRPLAAPFFCRRKNSMISIERRKRAHTVVGRMASRRY